MTGLYTVESERKSCNVHMWRHYRSLPLPRLHLHGEAIADLFIYFFQFLLNKHYLLRSSSSSFLTSRFNAGRQAERLEYIRSRKQPLPTPLHTNMHTFFSLTFIPLSLALALALALSPPRKFISQVPPLFPCALTESTFGWLVGWLVGCYGWLRSAELRGGVPTRLK